MSQRRKDGGARNVLFVTLDQWRGDCLGALGHPCLKTPNLDRLAGQGVAFTRDYTQASPCGPARASLLTGLYLHNHRSLRNGTPLDARHANVAREARRAGYDPMLFGYTDVAVDPRGRDPHDPELATYEGVLPGFSIGQLLLEDNAAWLADLRTKGYDIPASPKDIWLPRPGRRETRIGNLPPAYPAEHSETAFLTGATRRYLAQAKDNWFVHLSYLRPHPPYVAPEPYNTMYDPASLPPLVRAKDRAAERRQHPWLAAYIDSIYRGKTPVREPIALADLDDADVRQLRATYYGMISQVDDQIGRLLDDLTASGALERTLIIVTADHGDQLGDHWLWGKDGYFDQSFHIPLIVRDPRAQKSARGRVVDRFTEAVDVMPTILEWLGLDVPPACDGRSLMPFLAGQAPADWRAAAYWEYDFHDVRDPAFERALGIGLEDCRLTVRRDATSKYVHFAALPPLYFDLKTDPHELADRAGDPAFGPRVLAAAQDMLSWRMKSEDRALSHLHLGPGGAASRRNGQAAPSHAARMRA
mgnify:CR=1 FL=1